MTGLSLGSPTSGIPAWAPNGTYRAGDVRQQGGSVYFALQDHTAGSTFTQNTWGYVDKAPAQLYTNPYKGNLGVSTHIRAAASAGDMVTIAKRFKSFGFDWIREDASWSASEPTTKGTFVWTNFDNLMSAAAQAGLNILPVLTACPTWANGSGDAFVPPTTNQDYADFAVAFCTRYGAGGAFWTANPTLTPYPITYIELWNEPFGNIFFHGSGAEPAPWNAANGPSPAKYAAMCKAVGTTLHAGSFPQKILICGEPYGYSPGVITTPGFFATVLAAEPTLLTSNLFDGYVVHPYVGPFYYGPWDLPQGAGALQLLDPQGRFDRVIQSARQLAAAGGSGKEFWVTEYGWKSSDSSLYGVSDDVWTDYTIGGTRRLFREFGVTKAFLYTIEDMRASAGVVDAGSMLKYTSAGAPGNVRKPLPAVQRLVAAGDELKAYRDEVLADKPVLYTRLGHFAPVVSDISPSQVQGIVPSAAGLTLNQASLTTAPTGASTLFNGSSGTITIPSDARLSPATMLTLEAWIKCGHVPSATENLIRKMSQYQLQVTANGTLTADTTSGSNQVTVTAGTIPATTGYGITGTGIPASTTVIGVAGSVLTLSANATASNTGVTLQPGLALVSFVIYQSAAAQFNSTNVAEGLDVTKTWHITGSYDGVNMYLFVNGRLLRQTAKTGAIDTGTNLVGIGFQGNAASGFFNGQIQEAAIYAAALSPRRMAEHYQAGISAIAS